MCVSFIQGNFSFQLFRNTSRKAKEGLRGFYCETFFYSVFLPVLIIKFFFGEEETSPDNSALGNNNNNFEHWMNPNL